MDRAVIISQPWSTRSPFSHSLFSHRYSYLEIYTWSNAKIGEQGFAILLYISELFILAAA